MPCVSLCQRLKVLGRHDEEDGGKGGPCPCPCEDDGDALSEPGLRLPGAEGKFRSSEYLRAFV